MTTTANYIRKPELLNKASLYELRELVAHYPYYHAARIELLRNLFLLHDPTFSEELERAAPLLPDRRILFDMVEGVHFETRNTQVKGNNATAESGHAVSLIDEFLSTTETSASQKRKVKADPISDYVGYIMQLEEEEQTEVAASNKKSHGDELLDNFIENEPKRPALQEEIEYAPEIPTSENDEIENEADGSFLTETLAKIYIRQERYDKAIEIIRRLSANNPKKNSYFADQIRFLEKLLINNKYKK